MIHKDSKSSRNNTSNCVTFDVVNTGKQERYPTPVVAGRNGCMSQDGNLKLLGDIQLTCSGPFAVSLCTLYPENMSTKFLETFNYNFMLVYYKGASDLISLLGQLVELLFNYQNIRLVIKLILCLNVATIVPFFIVHLVTW